MKLNKETLSTLIKLAKENDEEFNSKVKEYIKEVPVSIIEVTSENKERLTQSFSFTPSKWGVDGKINTGTLDKVEYGDNPTYFEDGLLKEGVSIMVQSESDIYLTDKKPEDLGYIKGDKNDKIILGGNEEDFKLDIKTIEEFENLSVDQRLKYINSLMVVQKKNKIELLVKIEDLTSSLQKIFGQEIEFTNDKGLSQETNSDGYILVNKNDERQHIVNPKNEKSINPAGYITKEDLEKKHRKIKLTHIKLNDKKNQIIFIENGIQRNFTISEEFKYKNIDDLKNDRNFKNKDKYVETKGFKTFSNMLKKLYKLDISLISKSDNVELIEEKEKLIKEIKLVLNSKNNKFKLTSYEFTELKSAVDLAVISVTDSGIKIPLIKRKFDPQGYALPGGFIDDGETSENAAVRELKEETNITVDASRIEEIEKFSRKNENGENRDPRGQVETTLYKTMLSSKESKMLEAKAGDDAQKLEFFSIKEIITLMSDGKLAQGHEELIYKLIKSDYVLSQEFDVLLLKDQQFKLKLEKYLIRKRKKQHRQTDRASEYFSRFSYKSTESKEFPDIDTDIPEM